MKTSHLFSFGFGLLLFSGTAFASDKGPASIQNLQVSGNVRLYIVQGAAESIRTSGTVDETRQSILAEDGTLKIVSYGEDTLEVMITVTDLESIEADGNAVISATKLESERLSVALNDSAAAMFDDEQVVESKVKDDAVLIVD